MPLKECWELIDMGIQILSTSCVLSTEIYKSQQMGQSCPVPGAHIPTERQIPLFQSVYLPSSFLKAAWA